MFVQDDASQKLGVLKKYMEDRPTLSYAVDARWVGKNRCEKCLSSIAGAILGGISVLYATERKDVIPIICGLSMGAYVGYAVSSKLLQKSNVCVVHKALDFVVWKERAVSQGAYGEFLSVIKQRMPELMCRLTNDIIVNPVKDTYGRYYEDSVVQVELARNGSLATEKLCSHDFSWDFTYKTNVYRRLKAMRCDTSLSQVVRDGCAAYMSMYQKEISAIFEKMFAKWRVLNAEEQMSASESASGLQEIRMLLSEIEEGKNQ